MLTFLRILGWLVVVIVVLAGASYLLPRHVTVTRDIDIAAPPDVVFGEVNSLQAFSEWSPWSQMDPDMVLNYSGPAAGVGSRMEWTSEDPAVGSGSQEITESIADESVRTALDFGAMGTADAWFTLSPEGEGTNVVWGLNADMGNTPMGRYMGLAMDSLVGADYEKGLESLKAHAEAAAAEPEAAAVPEAAAEPAPTTEAEPAPAAKPETEAEPEAAPEPEAATEPEPATEAAPETEPAPAAEPEAEPEAVPEPAPSDEVETEETGG